MAYVKPQLLISQQFNATPTEVVAPLRPHLSGPLADLHRYDIPAEKDTIHLGSYDRLNDTAYLWPGREASGLVDMPSARLFMDNALLLYLEDTIGDASGGRGTVVPVAGTSNRIRSSTISFVANGTAWPRSGLLGDRDARIGDVIHVRGVEDPDGDCTVHELWTRIAGFAADTVAPVIGSASADAANQATTAATHSIAQTAGVVNCVSAAVNTPVAYNGLADGHVTESYTITVVASSVAGCNAARLRVTSASGTDNVAELTPADMGAATNIGTRGLQVIFDTTEGTCSLSASSSGVAESEFIVGQTWVVNVTQDFDEICAAEGATYTGAFDDTYILEVTKGGTWAQGPTVTVTTAKGLDRSGPTVVTGEDVSFPVGVHGLTASFEPCDGMADPLAGLCLGDKFYIQVTSGQNGPQRTLILRDDLPTALRTADDLDLRMFIQDNIEVTARRLPTPPVMNYTLEATQAIIHAGMVVYHDDWTINGNPAPLTVWSGVIPGGSIATQFGQLYLEYREFLTDYSDAVYFIESIDDINGLPGPFDPRNPLKLGLLRAWQNSNNSRIGYTAVPDPDNVSHWLTALAMLQGRDDIYNYVALTHNRTVLDAYAAQAVAESTPEAGSWAATVIAAQIETEKMLVGQSDAAVQALTPTSTDGAVVLATLLDNPAASGTQYTLLNVPAGNAGFITHGVRPGDTVRFLYSVNAYGDPTYRTFTVDQVLSESSLLLLAGHTSAITLPQKIEVWHNLTKSEIVTDLVDFAQSFANRRTVVTWPDMAGTAGMLQDGMFVSAAVAGRIAGVAPNQGLTNVEILGFDDLASRTVDFFSASQLRDLAAGGVWIVTEDRNGTPHTYHAVTTDTTDLPRREEMIRRNLDSISYVFSQRLRRYIGRANATPELLQRLRYEVLQVTKALSRSLSTDLGPQLLSATIAVDDTGVEILRIHPLAADRIEIVLQLVLPAPLNNLELHLVV